jgi:hypothetical protein
MRPRRMIVTLTALALAFGLAARPADATAVNAASAEDPTVGFPVVRTEMQPLSRARTWLLQGQRLANGGCRYRYPTAVEILPPTGWVSRSIAIDMDSCKKLFEEGVPVAVTHDDAELVTGAVAPAPSPVIALASTKGAWQRVVWRDLPGLLTTADMTQINWTYNGTTVSAGTTSAAWQFNTATKWRLTASSGSQLYGPGSSYYRGQTTATFANSFFCAPLPTVYTYYFHNRVWGHPNGTATRSQSSDSVDECLPLHVDVESAYGQWPG